MSSVAVPIPEMGESVTEAILVRWLKTSGELVALDEPICVLETDKADVELPAPAAGVLSTLNEPGDTIQVGDAVASIDLDATAIAAIPSTSATSVPADAAADAAATPAVRRLLQEHGLEAGDLEGRISGSGKGGRLTKSDVEGYIANAAATAPAQAVPAPPAAQPPPRPPSPQAAAGPRADSDHRADTREPMSKLRKRIAERLVAVKQQTAMLTTFNEVDMSAIIALRSQYKETFAARYGVSLGFMSFFARAVAVGLAEFPVLNAALDGDEIVYHGAVNLGVAVSTDRGLVVPVVRDADLLSFASLEQAIKRLGQAAREGTIELQALSGGTFTITNGGVFGSLLSTPILNPPQSGILGMHGIQKRPIAVDDQVAIKPMMYVALSYDHRLVDGRESVSFLVRVKQLLEDPARLMLAI